MPKLYPCVLTFTQEGKPLVDATVNFKSVNDPAFKWTIGAITNEAGVAEMLTHGQFRGVPEGEYKIIITKEENIQEKSANTPPVNHDWEEYTVGGGMISVFSHVEKEYTDQKTTPLTITIAKGKNKQDFDCGKAGRTLLRTVAP